LGGLTLRLMFQRCYLPGESRIAPSEHARRCRPVQHGGADIEERGGDLVGIKGLTPGTLATGARVYGPNGKEYLD